MTIDQGVINHSKSARGLKGSGKQLNNRKKCKIHRGGVRAWMEPTRLLVPTHIFSNSSVNGTKAFGCLDKMGRIRYGIVMVISKDKFFCICYGIIVTFW